MPAEPITREWIAQHGGTRLVFHANAGDRHILTREVVDKRYERRVGLTSTDTSYKRNKRNGDLAGRSTRAWYVEGHDGKIASLAEALEILRIQRLGAEPAEAA